MTANGRILVVDDYPDAREFIQVLLEGAGFIVCTAASGEEAVAVACDESPDAVLMDLHLPGTSGVEATRRIKSIAGLKDTPVIAYTAREDYARGWGDLFFDVCSKPCRLGKLLALIDAALVSRGDVGPPRIA
jgi:twitching motility two-component system response regulator PilH